MQSSRHGRTIETPQMIASLHTWQTGASGVDSDRQRVCRSLGFRFLSMMRRNGRTERSKRVAVDANNDGVISARTCARAKGMSREIDRIAMKTCGDGRLHQGSKEGPTWEIDRAMSSQKSGVIAGLDPGNPYLKKFFCRRLDGCEGKPAHDGRAVRRRPNAKHVLQRDRVVMDRRCPNRVAAVPPARNTRCWRLILRRKASRRR